MTTNTGIAASVRLNMFSYRISQMAALRLVEQIAAENSNVTAISSQPGVVATDIAVNAFEHFAFDAPELVGGTGV